MEKILETKTVAVAKVPSGATVVLYVALVDGVPTEAQIETGRNALTATLEIVGATNASSYLTRFPAVKLANDETLRLDVDVTLAKVAPDPLPDAVEPETLDETPSTESALSEEVAADGSDKTSLDDNAAAIAEPETSEA
ncbi:MAG: hypothetical protein IJE97_15005 [Thermoguttaceae bacterium]|nr:hypothetical protein [Thermoguttaceae bacterium]MBQ7109589.1 hypothetical protein [Thermoguttaceae bacterium]